MNLKQLEAFVHVAESRSFSKAAKELYLTQPTVSAHISSLEKELNTRLLIRNTKEVDLSENGKMLYNYARQMIELQRKIEQTFSEISRQKGHECISIAASTVPAQYLLPEVLARFREKYPEEQLRVMETDSAKVVSRVIENSIDIGFNGTILEKKHCKYIPFYRDELVIITPNDEHFRKYKESPGEIGWIEQEPVLMREPGSGTRKEAEKLLKQSGIDLDNLNIIASIANQEIIKKSVMNGMGVAVISHLAAKEEVEEEKMLEFPLPVADSGRDINIVYNKNRQLSMSAERFLKVVKEVYKVKVRQEKPRL